MHKAHSSFSAIFALASVIFIDALGMAILFPLFNALFMDPKIGILPASASLELRHFYYGVSLSIFPLATLFSAPVLGDISDKIGRKKILIISLAGAFLSYILSGGAVYLKSVILFLIGRLIAGLTAGSQPIAQAAIIDISHPEKKAHNLSIIMGAMAFGWVGGPLLGGFLTDSSVVSWFNPAIALFCAALLSLLNLLILQLFFRETLREKKKLVKLHLHKGPMEFVLAFKLKNIRVLSAIFLLLEIGWAFYFGYVSLFLNARFQLSAHAVGVFLAFMAVGFALPSFGMVKAATKYLTKENAAASALGISGVVFLLTCITSPQNYVLWVISVLVGVSVGMAMTFFLALFSDRVSLAEQGRIMGITMAIISAAWAFSAFFGSFIANIGPSMPLVVGGIVMIISSVLTYIYSFKRVRTSK
jgi:MFS transporter, DHA1 family, tetracycline resistance protein